MEEKKKKYISKEQAKQKLQRYCAYQERCHKEVRNKLLNLGIYGDDLEEVIYDLITENFLNEERFAQSFARGKYRMSEWGRNRILMELKRREISAYCIRKAMAEIDEEEYQAIMYRAVKKRFLANTKLDPYPRKQKILAFAYRKGYEFEEVQRHLNQLEYDWENGDLEEF